MHFDKLFERSISANDEKRNINISQVSLCDKLPSKFQCTLCHLLLQNPLQTCRGELACERCYTEALQDTGICPIDGLPIKRDQYYNDKFISTQIQRLSCFCFNKSRGCAWKGQISELKCHTLQCEYKTVKCCLCDDVLLQLKMSQHLRDCPNLSLDGKCIYPGCTFKPVNGADLESHMKEDVINHALLSQAAMRDMQTHFDALYEAEKKRTDDNKKKLENKIEDLVTQFSSLIQSAKEAKEESERTILALQNRIDVLEKGSISSLQKLNNESHEMGTSQSIKQIQSTLSNLDLRQRLAENTSYDGKLIWKIDNFSTRMSQAKNGSIQALHSAPVFTSNYGYKFCGKLYINGDGMGKGSHLSLYFVLMKSEYDDLLSWPLQKKVTMRLIHSSNPAKDVVESFATDPASTSFFKPTKDMNVASGCPQFIKLEDLICGGFIQDNAIFLEVSVL